MLLLLMAAAVPATAAAARRPATGPSSARTRACEQPMKGGGVKVRGAAWLNGDDDAVELGIGQYAAVARGRNSSTGS